MIRKWLLHATDCKARQQVERCVFESEYLRHILHRQFYECPVALLDVILSYLPPLIFEVGGQVGGWKAHHYTGHPQPRQTVTFDPVNDRVGKPLAQDWQIEWKTPLECYYHRGMSMTRGLSECGSTWERVGIRLRVCTSPVRNRSSGWVLIGTLFAPAANINWTSSNGSVQPSTTDVLPSNENVRPSNTNVTSADSNVSALLTNGNTVEAQPLSDIVYVGTTSVNMITTAGTSIVTVCTWHGVTKDFVTLARLSLRLE